MLAVGVDVSKGKSMVAALTEHGELVMRPREYGHSESEMGALIAQLQIYDEVRIVLEATSHYHFPIVKRFQSAGLFVSVVNPFLMKKYLDGSIRKGKTDKKDAIKIATYCLEKWHKLTPHSPLDKQYDELRFLSRQYNQTVSMRVKGKVWLSQLLDQIMPGIKTIFKGEHRNPDKNVLYDFIEKYGHYENVLTLGMEKFMTEFTAWAKEKGYRYATSKAEQIYLLAQNAIPSRAADSSGCLALMQCVFTLKQSEHACNAILAQMREIAMTLPEYGIVRAMSGVGDRLAPRLIAEIGDVRRFTSAKALNAYAGNDAPPYQSGQYEGTRRHISKRGSKSLRKAGYEAMKALKTVKPVHDDAVYRFMLQKEAEGKPKNVAKMAGLNKFLRIYYARVSEVYGA